MKIVKVSFFLLAICFVQPPSAMADYVWHFSLGGTPPGPWYLELEVFSRSLSLSSTVTIPWFTTTAMLGPSSTLGDVSGSVLQLPLVLGSTAPTNQYLQEITSIGTSGLSPDTVNFDFVLSTNFGPFDEFDVFMLGSDHSPFSTGDPTGGNAVVRGDSASQVEEFLTPFLNTLTVTNVNVPEPRTFLFGLVGLGWLIWRSYQRARSDSPALDG
jgi:hypothetical protein